MQHIVRMKVIFSSNLSLTLQYDIALILPRRCARSKIQSIVVEFLLVGRIECVGEAPTVSTRFHMQNT